MTFEDGLEKSERGQLEIALRSAEEALRLILLHEGETGRYGGVAKSALIVIESSLGIEGDDTGAELFGEV